MGDLNADIGVAHTKHIEGHVREVTSRESSCRAYQHDQVTPMRHCFERNRWRARSVREIPVNDKFSS